METGLIWRMDCRRVIEILLMIIGKILKTITKVINISNLYYEKKNEKGKVTWDNYTEITQNISRHFNDKKLMREKIVNKTLCEPLPQIQLPKK